MSASRRLLLPIELTTANRGPGDTTLLSRRGGPPSKNGPSHFFRRATGNWTHLMLFGLFEGDPVQPPWRKRLKKVLSAAKQPLGHPILGFCHLLPALLAILPFLLVKREKVVQICTTCINSCISPTAYLGFAKSLSFFDPSVPNPIRTVLHLIVDADLSLL